MASIRQNKLTRQRFRSQGLGKRLAANTTTDAAQAPLVIPTYTVAGAPAAADHTGEMIRVSNGAAGQPCLAVSNGTNWLRVVYGAAIAAA